MGIILSKEKTPKKKQTTGGATSGVIIANPRMSVTPQTDVPQPSSLRRLGSALPFRNAKVLTLRQ
jgi:hypothetical protein